MERILNRFKNMTSKDVKELLINNAIYLVIAIIEESIYLK